MIDGSNSRATGPAIVGLAFAFSFAAAFAAACTNVGDYSTEPGECYEGRIVGAEFVRSSNLSADLEMTLSLDANALGRGEEGAQITTDDGTFDRAPVRQMTQLTHDSLSLLQFPGGRVHNFLTYVQPTHGEPATAVISLMENDEVEVRVLRPDVEPDDLEDSSLFGVFRLVRNNDCAAFD